MKKSTKRTAIMAASLMLAGFGLISSNVNATPPTDPVDEYKTFTDCWGSGAAGVSCPNSGAVVYGCEPDPGSYCVGKLRQ